MSITITPDYLNNLAPIYRNILCAFPNLEPTRRAGYDLAYGTLFSHLRDDWSPGEVEQACNQMEKGGAVTIKNGIFVHPTPLGEEIIAALTGKKAPERREVPPFSPPAGGAG